MQTGVELERLYWIHVEYFCAHHCTGLNLAIDNLIDIMTQGRTGSDIRSNDRQRRKLTGYCVTDQITSTTSTFPYDINDCGRFVECLQTLKTSKQDSSAFAKWTGGTCGALFNQCRY